MWINQNLNEPRAGNAKELNKEKSLPEAEALEIPLEEPKQIIPADTRTTDLTDAVRQVPPKPSERLSARRLRSNRDCILLAAAYLLGTLLAGVAAAYGNTGEHEAFSYYLSCWQKLFSIGNAQEAIGLFRTEFLTMAGALATLLLLGLSALGPLPIFLFTILYGTGSGLLSSQFLLHPESSRMLVQVLLCGVPAAIGTGIVCTFGAFSLQTSGRLCSNAFRPGGQIHGVRNLIGPFVCALFLLLPLCGAAVGLLYLAEQGIMS